MKTLSIALGAAIALVAAPASAHAPHVGPKNGHTIHWGQYHFELAPGADAARLYVYSAATKQPMTIKGISAKARILSGGKLSNVVFTPAAGNVLVAPQAKLAGDWTALVTISLPGKGAPNIRYSAKDLQALRNAAAKTTGHDAH